MSSGPGPLALRILVVFLTVFLGAAVADRVMKVVPAQYLSTVTIQVRNPSSMGGVRPFEKTRQLILRREVLEPVTKSLGLTGTDPVAQLRRALSVREVRNTELVRISATADTPTEAARRANAVAEEFQRREIEAQKKQTDYRLEPLQAEVAAQRARVEAAHAAASAIRMKLGIEDLNPTLDEEAGTLDEAIEKAKAKAADLRAKQKKLAALSDEQVLDEISRDTDFGKSLDPTLSEISANLRLAENQEAVFTARGLGQDHPTVKRLRAQAAMLRNQLFDLVPVFRKRIEFFAAAEEARAAGLENLATKPESERRAAEKYSEAKRLYLREQKILEAAKLKLSTEKIDSILPQNPAVIWEKAEPPAAPDSRLRMLLAIGVLLGLIVGCGLAFLPRPGLMAGGVAVLLAVALAPRLLASGQAVLAKPLTPRISVGGDVKSPQLLDYAEDLTILRVINAAGGFTKYADQKKVRLLRDGRVMVVDVTAIRQDPAKDIPLKPGDSIEVPQSFW